MSFDQFRDTLADTADHLRLTLPPGTRFIVLLSQTDPDKHFGFVATIDASEVPRLLRAVADAVEQSPPAPNGQVTH